MQAGVYEKIKSPGNYYLLLGAARMHDPDLLVEGTDNEFVLLVPLRVEAGWAGTARISIQVASTFSDRFRWVGIGLPDPVTVPIS